MIVTSALAFVAMFRLNRAFRWRRSKRFQRAYRDAIVRGDLFGAKREIERVYGDTRLGRDIAKLYKASELFNAARFDESLRLLESIPRGNPEGQMLPLILNQIAWCYAHTGRAHEAVTTAREALERAGETAFLPFPQWMASFRTTLGMSLVHAGRPDEALPYLSQALKDHDRPDRRSVVAFYMGTAYEGLGRRDEARASFERSVREAPESRSGKSAHSRLVEAYPSLKA